MVLEALYPRVSQFHLVAVAVAIAAVAEASVLVVVPMKDRNQPKNFQVPLFLPLATG